VGSTYNPFCLNGKRFLVTGAASGIGRATSIVLSKLGAALILVDVNADGLAETQAACGPADKTILLDLSICSLIKNALFDAVSESGKLDGFVHLAGRAYISPLKAISEETCKEVFAINTYAAVELAKVFAHRNVYAGSAGSIVLISSVYAVVGSAANVGYAMSKSALHGVTKALAIELASKKIRVNCIAPGFVNTRMLGSMDSGFVADHGELLEKLHPLGIGEPEDVAYAVAYLLSDAARWITGAVLNVDGGFTAQ
jgi:NAD(P)-dependent dehydrogenase (short-subunit alcohol dehydrogenase family)